MDRITPIHPGIPSPQQVQDDVVRGLEAMLAQAKDGQLKCVIGVGLHPNGTSSEYHMGDPGTGIALLGQLDMAHGVLMGRCMRARQLTQKF